MEKRILYFDCFSGISGDMTIGALLDLGIDQDEFVARLNKINLDEFDLEIKKGLKKGISGTDFTVILKDREGEGHHHHEPHGHHHADAHEHHHPHSHGHAHEPKHEHPVVHHSVEHHHKHSRNIQDINSIIDQSDLSDFVKKTSKHIFHLVAVAEAKIHAKPVEEIHFHEIGAVDSIVDIIGAAIAIEMLGVDEIHSSALNLGSGFVHCEHGIFPVPAPATLEILKNVPVYSRNASKELTTPTGAAIIKALSKKYGLLPECSIERIGYGLGKRDMETPNVLRVILAQKN